MENNEDLFEQRIQQWVNQGWKVKETVSPEKVTLFFPETLRVNLEWKKEKKCLKHKRSIWVTSQSSHREDIDIHHFSMEVDERMIHFSAFVEEKEKGVFFQYHIEKMAISWLTNMNASLRTHVIDLFEWFEKEVETDPSIRLKVATEGKKVIYTKEVNYLLEENVKTSKEGK